MNTLLYYNDEEFDILLKGEVNFFKVFFIFSSDRKALQIMNCAF